MALLTSELDRIRHEMGYNLLRVGAEPWVGISSLFDNVIAPYTRSGALTTSSSEVAGPLYPGAPPTQSVIKLTDPTGFNSGDRIIVDVDDAQEALTVQGMTGPLLLGMFSKAHNRTYSVTVEGGESIIREILVNIRNVKAKMADSYGTGALKQVDEISFYEAQGQTYFGLLGGQLCFWRDELASALGIRSMWKRRSGGGSRLAVY